MEPPGFPGRFKDTVARIWRARNLRPWQIERFKLSNDPHFEEKLIDIVGLLLDPRERAVVLCVDDKSGSQALERTQPSLPMTPGRAGTRTHDYKRHGTKCERGWITLVESAFIFTSHQPRRRG